MKQWHLLAYDIREEKRLRKLHYYLKKRAVPLQRSVFLLHCTAEELAQTLQGARKRVHLRDDDIRLYPVSSPHSLWAAGKQAESVRGLYPAPAKTTPDNWLQQVGKALFG